MCPVCKKKAIDISNELVRITKKITAINGVVKESEYLNRRISLIKPTELYYEESEEQPYIKYSCPVCATIGNLHQITPDQDNCPLCGVNLVWEN